MIQSPLLLVLLKTLGEILGKTRGYLVGSAAVLMFCPDVDHLIDDLDIVFPNDVPFGKILDIFKKDNPTLDLTLDKHTIMCGGVKVIDLLRPNKYEKSPNKIIINGIRVLAPYDLLIRYNADISVGGEKPTEWNEYERGKLHHNKKKVEALEKAGKNGLDLSRPSPFKRKRKKENGLVLSIPSPLKKKNRRQNGLVLSRPSTLNLSRPSPLKSEEKTPTASSSDNTRRTLFG